MNWFHAPRGLIDRHPFASDAVLAVAVAAFVLQDLWTSGDYLTASARREPSRTGESD